jgi:hypothetical protein
MSEPIKINIVQKKIIKSILYGNYHIMNIFFARIHTCSKNSEYWLYSGLEGALIYCIDIKLRTCKFLMIDLKTYEIVFDFELYKKFDKAYRKGTERFYYFEVENGFIGFEIPYMEHAEILYGSILSFGDEYIKVKLREYKPMKENELKEKANKMISYLEKRLGEGKVQPKMLRSEIVLKHGLLEKLINTVELNEETGKIIVKGNGYSGVDSELLKINDLSLDLETNPKVGNTSIFTNYISRNILRSFMKGLIIPKRKINRGEGVTVEKIPQYQENAQENEQESEIPKKEEISEIPKEEIKKIMTYPEPKKAIPPQKQLSPKKQEIKQLSPPKKQEIKPPSQPKSPEKQEIQQPAPPKPQKKQEIKQPAPPKPQKKQEIKQPPQQQKKQEIKQKSPPKMQKEEEIRQPSPPKTVEVVQNSDKSIPPPPPPPPPPPSIPVIPTVKSKSSSKPSKPIDLAAELAAKKKNLTKVETKDLSVPNVQKSSSSSSTQSGNSMMTAILAQRNAMKRSTAPTIPASSLPKTNIPPKKSVVQAQKTSTNIKPSTNTKPNTNNKPNTNTFKKTQTTLVNPPPQKSTQNNLNKTNSIKPSTTGGKLPMKTGGGGGFAAMRNMLANRMAPQKQVKKDEGPKKPIVELAAGSNVPRMNMSKLMASLEKNMGKSEDTSSGPVEVISCSGPGIPPPPPPPPPPPSA